MPDSRKLVNELGLKNGSLFVAKVELLATGRKVEIQFMYETGDFHKPEITYFSVEFQDCKNVKLFIEGEDEVEDRQQYLWGTHDIIGLTLGQDEYQISFEMVADGLEMSFRYKQRAIKLLSD
jgi:hypothetical protein